MREVRWKAVERGLISAFLGIIAAVIELKHSILSFRSSVLFENAHSLGDIMTNMAMLSDADFMGLTVLMILILLLIGAGIVIATSIYTVLREEIKSRVKASVPTSSDLTIHVKGVKGENQISIDLTKPDLLSGKFEDIKKRQPR